VVGPNVANVGGLWVCGDLEQLVVDAEVNRGGAAAADGPAGEAAAGIVGFEGGLGGD